MGDFDLWFSRIGTGASLMGFVITVYVAYKVRYLRSERIRAKRIPVLVAAIRNSASAIPDLLHDYSRQKQRIAELLSQIHADLKSLHAKVPRTDKRAIQNIRDDP